MVIHINEISHETPSNAATQPERLDLPNPYTAKCMTDKHHPTNINSKRK